MFDSIASLNSDQLRVKEKCEVIRNEMCDIYLSYDNINQENKDYTLIQINSILDIQKDVVCRNHDFWSSPKNPDF